MRALIGYADANGIWQLELSVASDNPRAIRFYERCGFKQQGLFPNAVILDGGVQDDLFYTLDLRGRDSTGTHKA